MPVSLEAAPSAAAEPGADFDQASPLWLRIGIFLAVYAALQWAYQALRATRAESWLIDVATVRPAAALIDALAPADRVVAAGSRLVWPGGRLGLQNGCDGFEVLAVFVAAVLVAEVAWRRGTIALVLGCAAIWAANQVRIAGLYASFRHRPEWFDAIHTVWGPAALVVVAAAAYVGATRR